MSEKTNPKADARLRGENVIEFPRSRFTALRKGQARPKADAINHRELISIKALTSYVAYNKNVPEDIVRAYLLAEFNVDDPAKLRREDFERVIKFLVDLRAELLIN